MSTTQRNRFGFGHVGLVPSADTHLLVRNNQFLYRMGFPRLWIYLGTTPIRTEDYPPSLDYSTSTEYVQEE